MKNLIKRRHVILTLRFLLIGAIFSTLMLQSGQAAAITQQAAWDSAAPGEATQAAQILSAVSLQNYSYLPLIIRSCLFTYKDDFSDPASGWPIVSTDYYSMGYKDGEYFINVNAELQATAVHDFGFSDFIVEVDARPSSLEGAVGIVFGMPQEYKYYAFEVYDGMFALYRVFNYEWTPLIGWTASSAINPGTAVNRLGVQRAGSSISLYANGKLLATVEDGTYQSGYLGMAANFDTGPFEGRFDNLEVRSGQCNPGVAGVKDSGEFLYSVQEGGGWRPQH